MSDLKRVVELGELMRQQESEVERLTGELKEAKKKFEKTSRDVLPDLMTELGLTEITLSDGSKITVKEEVDAAITERTRAAAHNWLSEHGFGGLIKTNVAVQFATGERDIAIELVEKLAQDYPDTTMKEVVHPQTLKAFVREQMAAGAAIPMDVFNIRPYNIVKLKKGK